MATNNRHPRLREMIFARSAMRFEMHNLFRENTDIWVFGTKGAYRKFTKRLDAHARGKSRHTRMLAASDEAGMDVLLLPMCSDAVKPFLLMQERMVRRNGCFNMELMIGGCGKGFGFLRDQFSTLIERDMNDVDDHEHVDVGVPLVLESSVFLNIRGPVNAWNRRTVGETHWDVFVVKNITRFPADASALVPESWGNELLGYDDLYARIPRRPRARNRTRKS